MSTATETSIELLVGEMPELPCESLGHFEDVGHGGPAAQYARLFCPECGPSQAYAYCAPFIEFCRTPGHGVECRNCKRISEAAETVQVIGPVKP